MRRLCAIMQALFNAMCQRGVTQRGCNRGIRVKIFTLGKKLIAAFNSLRKGLSNEQRRTISTHLANWKGVGNVLITEDENGSCYFNATNPVKKVFKVQFIYSRLLAQLLN